ncbi:MAG TPA: HIT family protein [Acidimicrobiales bacterium]|jgi:histidine triad (HIT) family protein|nr:HIT family protein [Acidimicrobiales bacterium]
MGDACTFCRVRDGDVPAAVVLDEPAILAFLDHRPLFPGHVLVLPREHRPTLVDVPAGELGALFAAVQRLASAVPTAMGAQGTFVALNNVVSQSVPHLHVHVVPRTKGDGLRGFFWPRHRYASDGEMAETARRIRTALAAG